jgi:hypothetical protein
MDAIMITACRNNSKLNNMLFDIDLLFMSEIDFVPFKRPKMCLDYIIIKLFSMETI